MKYVFAFALLAVMALFQTSAAPELTVLGVHPNLLLVFLLSWAMLRGLDEAMIIVPAGALMLGLVDGQPLGAAVLATMPIVLLTLVREARIVHSDFLLALLLIVVCTLAYETVYLLVFSVTGDPVVWWDSFTRVVVPATIVNAVLLPPVYWVLWLSSRDLRRAIAI